MNKHNFSYKIENIEHKILTALLEYTKEGHDLIFAKQLPYLLSGEPNPDNAKCPHPFVFEITKIREDSSQVSCEIHHGFPSDMCSQMDCFYFEYDENRKLRVSGWEGVGMT